MVEHVMIGVCRRRSGRGSKTARWVGRSAGHYRTNSMRPLAGSFSSSRPEVDVIVALAVLMLTPPYAAASL